MMQKIANIRVVCQQLINPQFIEPQEIVSWMGAMQAQDFNMAKWAVGIRSKSTTEQNVEEAFNKGEILRTHVMRPTWHFVSPKDIRWMLKLSVQRIKSSSASRDRDLDITENLYTKTNDLIEKMLAGGNHLTREGISSKLNAAGIVVNTSRMIHFMMRAEVEGIVCSGSLKGKKQTYALIDERIAPVAALCKDEALATLARRYFMSHSPASLQDFVWWSGLAVVDAKEAMGLIASELSSTTFGSYTLFVHQSVEYHSQIVNIVHCLPAFDEYVISYKDRTSILALEHHSKAFTKNGIFYPHIMYDGNIVGTWKKIIKKGMFSIDPLFFEPDFDLNTTGLEVAKDLYYKFAKK